MQKYIDISIDCRNIDINTIMAMVASVAADGATQRVQVNPENLNIKVTLERAGESGVAELKKVYTDSGWQIDTDGQYIQVYARNLNAGVNRIGVWLQQGTNKLSFLGINVHVPDGAESDGLYEYDDEIEVDVVKSFGTGGGGGMQYCRLTLVTGRDAHFVAPDGSRMSYADVKEAVLDENKFVFLDHADCYHIPCFVVEEGSEAIGFTSAFSVDGKPHIERVAINAAGQINTHNYPIVAYNGNNGVEIGVDCSADSGFAFAHGDGCEAEGYGTHAEGQNSVASAECSHAEGDSTIANGIGSHAEGVGAQTNGDASHAEGDSTIANGIGSHAEGSDTEAGDDYSHAEGQGTKANGFASHAEGCRTVADSEFQHVQGKYNDPDDFIDHAGAFMHGCGTSEQNRKNAFGIAEDGKVYVIGLGGYDGTNHEDALSLQELFGTSNIQTTANKLVNNYQVPDLTVAQVTAAYNAVVAGRSVTITDATGNYHLAVMQADNLSGDLAISIIYLNVMLLTYEVTGTTVDVQFKTL